MVDIYFKQKRMYVQLIIIIIIFVVCNQIHITASYWTNYYFRYHDHYYNIYVCFLIVIGTQHIVKMQ